MIAILIRAAVGLVFACLGLVGLFSPATTRRLISRFLEKAPVRILGIVLMLLGAGVFRVADALYLPMAGKVLGVALFMAGGVHIFIPEFAIVLNEWWVLRSTLWERLVSVVYLALAALLFTPGQPAQERLDGARTAPAERRESAPPDPETEPASPQEDSGESPDAPSEPSPPGETASEAGANPESSSP